MNHTYTYAHTNPCITIVSVKLRKQAMKAHLPTYIVCDAGRTQIPSGSKTVLAIGPGKYNMYVCVCAFVCVCFVPLDLFVMYYRITLTHHIRVYNNNSCVVVLIM